MNEDRKALEDVFGVIMDQGVEGFSDTEAMVRIHRIVTEAKVSRPIPGRVPAAAADPVHTDPNSTWIMKEILERHGFDRIRNPGYVAGERSDGITLRLFRWQGPVIARAQNLPRAYIVVVFDTGVRFRLPLVEWSSRMPVKEQDWRPRKDVLAEFAETFAPLLGATSAEQCERLNVERYRLS